MVRIGARCTTQQLQKNIDNLSRELQVMDGGVGLFVEWTDYIESEGGTLEESTI